MPDAHTNFAYSTVVAAPSPADTGTSLVVQTGDGAKFPTPPFNVTVWPVGDQPLTTNAEIVRVTAISVDTFTITRTQEGTTARAILVGDQIAATITAKTLTDIETAIRKAANLKVGTDNAAAPANQVRITVDEATIFGTVLSSVDVTADITVSGVNGLDVGVRAASTWYAVYLIFNPVTNTVAGLLSANFTTPTLPTGYPKSRRVGSVRNDNANVFVPFRQVGDRARFLDLVGDANHQRILANGAAAAAFTTLTGSTFIPPKSLRAILAGIAISGTSGNVWLRPTGSGVPNGDILVGTGGAGLSTRSAHGEFDVSTGQQIDYRTDGSLTSIYIDVVGYLDPVL